MVVAGHTERGVISAAMARPGRRRVIPPPGDAAAVKRGGDTVPVKGGGGGTIPVKGGGGGIGRAGDSRAGREIRSNTTNPRRRSTKETTRTPMAVRTTIVLALAALTTSTIPMMTPLISTKGLQYRHTAALGVGTVGGVALLRVTAYRLHRNQVTAVIRTDTVRL